MDRIVAAGLTLASIRRRAAKNSPPAKCRWLALRMLFPRAQHSTRPKWSGVTQVELALQFQSDFDGASIALSLPLGNEPTSTSSKSPAQLVRSALDRDLQK